MSYTEYFKGKRVTVIGLGLLGRGVGDAAYIAAAGAAEVIVTDKKTAAELATSIEQLKDYDNITFVLGEHRHEDFTDRDFILVAAGVPMDSPYLATARAAGVPLKQSAALFAELTNVPIIGVTGTRGKSTVTHLIHHTLSTVTDGSVLLGGNVRGRSNLQLLNDVTDDSVCVMELDSWQLQGFGWAKRSPQISVFTNFMRDHMNYYHDDMDAYFADKANIFRYQAESDTLILTPEVFEYAKKLNLTLGQEVVLVDDSLIPTDAVLTMPGAHNRLNYALALAALRATSLTDEEIFHGFATFPGVPGRLEYLGERDDVKIYNDNNATTPQATTAGLAAVGNVDEKNVVLIAGGADKGLATDGLVEGIATYCKAVFLLPGTGTDALAPQLTALAETVHVEQVASLYGAVASALAHSVPGDTLLFSPGYASFGLFKNEYDRNDQFIEAVHKITKDVL